MAVGIMMRFSAANLRRYRPLLLFFAALVLAACLFGIYQGATAWTRGRMRRDRRFCITRLVESSEGSTSVRAGAVEELLSLRPAQNLFAFDIERAEERLRSHPVFKSATIWRCPPNTLSVRYRARSPLAQVQEWPNWAIDGLGYVFPINPFLTPKRLPRLILGLPAKEGTSALNQCERSGRLRGNRTELGIEILQYLSQLLAGEGTRISRLDVSQAFARDLGKRYLRVVLQDQLFIEGKRLVCRRSLKLNCHGWRAQLHRYRRLHLLLARQELLAVRAIPKEQLDKTRFQLRETIDLRIDLLAFIQVRSHQLS